VTARHQSDPAPASESDTTDPLHALRTALREAVESVRRKDFRFADRQLSSITRLEMGSLNREELIRRASALRDSLEKAKRLKANRIALVVLCVLSGLALVVLLVIPVPSVQIAASVRANSVAFNTLSEISVGNLRALQVDLTGLLQSATLDQGPQRSAGARESGRQRFDLRANTPFAQLSVEGPRLLLDRINAPSGISIVMEALNEPPGFRVSLSDAPAKGEISNGERTERPVRRYASGEISTGERLKLVASDFIADRGVAVEKPFTLNQGGLVVFKAATSNLAVNVGTLDDSSIDVARNVLIDGMRFSSKDVDRLESGVLSGALRLVDFRGDPITLSAGDRLTLAAGKRLQVTSIAFDKAFVVNLKGEVSSIELNSRSLKPSMLAWMRQHREVVLFLGAFTSLVSALWLAMTRLEILRS